MFKFNGEYLTDGQLVTMDEGLYALVEAEHDKQDERNVYDTRYYAVEDFICTLPNMIQKMLQPAFEKFNEYEDEELKAQKNEIDAYAKKQFMQGTTETDILMKSLFYTISQNDINSGILPDFNFTIYSTMSLLNLQNRLEKHPRAGIDATTALLLRRRELQFRNDLL